MATQLTTQATSKSAFSAPIAPTPYLKSASRRKRRRTDSVISKTTDGDMKLPAKGAGRLLPWRRLLCLRPTIGWGDSHSNAPRKCAPCISFDSDQLTKMSLDSCEITAHDQNAISSLPGNERCAECESLQPQWTSVNLGIVLCLDCAGLHRSLGVHISFVRSMEMDVWTEEHVSTMLAGGNSRVRLYLGEPEGQDAGIGFGERYQSTLADKYRKELEERAIATSALKISVKGVPKNVLNSASVSPAPLPPSALEPFLGTKPDVV